MEGGFGDQERESAEQFGFTVNVGISANKLLAKMASDFEKPDKVHTLFPDEITDENVATSNGRTFYGGAGRVWRY